MRFYDPTNVYLEKNCVQNHKKELLALGTRAFIITGRHSAKVNGSLDDVLAVLEEASIPYSIFDEIEENPSVETVARAAEIGKEFQADFVIGIGGGSPMDASKAISLLIANPEETSDCFYIEKDLKALPVAAIPTTCGTGSEVTAVSVLTRHNLKTKKSIAYKIFPELSLIDGKYLAKASQKILISTSVDALAHLVESYLSTKSNLYNRMFSEYGLKLWKDILPILTSEVEPDEDSYEKMMLISTIAGMAIAQTGTSFPHALSYRITYTYGVAHGKACGIFLAAYMKEYADNCPNDIHDILSLLGFASLEDFGACLQTLLGTVAVSRAELEANCKELATNQARLSTFPFPIAEEGVRRILESSLEVTE